MLPKTELSKLIESISARTLNLFTSYKHDPDSLHYFTEKYISLIRDFFNFLSTLSQNPEKLLLSQIAYWQDAGLLANNQFLDFLTNQKQQAYFDSLNQHYLLYKEHINCFLEKMDVGDPTHNKKIRFFTQQFLDALSPNNFIMTNPKLLTETIAHNGQNLLKGLNNFLDDIDSGSARLIMKMTDHKAFKVGKNIACSKGKIIYKNNLIELIAYTPIKKVKSIPLLIIPPWINKYYILDLSKHNSLVKWLTEAGLQVYMISWVNPDKSFANKDLSDYLNEGPLAAIDVIKKQHNINKVNTLGFCIGGTLLAILLAYCKSKKMNIIQSATFLASMIDFSDPGEISVYIDEDQIKLLEKRMNQKGYLEGELMANAFYSLRATDLIWSYFVKNYLHGHSHVPFDILYWNSDTTNMPAKMHSQYLRSMYLQNDLIKPNKIKINNTPINIHNIKLPVFFVSTEKDHIAPWQTTYIGFAAFKGEKQFILGGSGHIGGIINPPAAKKYGFYSSKNYPQNSGEWLKSAKYTPGSWWETWLKWLMKRSGNWVKSQNLKNLPLKGLYPAPGQYVIKS